MYVGCIYIHRYEAENKKEKVAGYCRCMKKKVWQTRDCSAVVSAAKSHA